MELLETRIETRLKKLDITDGMVISKVSMYLTIRINDNIILDNDNNELMFLITFNIVKQHEILRADCYNLLYPSEIIHFFINSNDKTMYNILSQKFFPELMFLMNRSEISNILESKVN